MGLAVAVAAFCVVLPPLLFGLGQCKGAIAMSAAHLAIPLLTLVLAVLVGMQFPLAARVDCRDATTTSARLYTADYLGAALGALLVSTLLIPVLGVIERMPAGSGIESARCVGHAGKSVHDARVEWDAKQEIGWQHGSR